MSEPSIETLFPTGKHGDLIYDVGMHRGEDTDFYLKKGFRCVGIEADPDNAQFCREKFAECIHAGKLVIIEGAIVAPEIILKGQNVVRFYKNEDLSVLGTVLTDWADLNVGFGTRSRIIEVPVVNFTSVLKEHGIPHYLKIDIEGSDLICIQSLERFAERPAYLSFEKSRDSIRDNRDEITLLKSLGYNSFQIVEQSEIPLTQTPPIPSLEGKYVDHKFIKDSSGLFGAELNAKWRSAEETLQTCRGIQLGHYLVGNKGIMKSWRFSGADRLRSWAQYGVWHLTRTAVPGWHDIHAKHSSVDLDGTPP